MTSIRELLLAGAIASLGLAGTMTPANATPFSTSFTVNIWHFTCNNCQKNFNSQKALPTNPGRTAGNLLYTGNYTGAMDFSVPGNGSNSIGAFFSSGGGTSSPDLNGLTAKLSTGTYNGSRDLITTLMEFTFSIGDSVNLITHDDGISIFAAGDTTTDLLPIADAGPTTAESSNITLAAGNYDLWYVEANGLPAELKFDTTATGVPEPASLGLLGFGLVALGCIRRRIRRA